MNPAAINLSVLPKPIQVKVKLMGATGQPIYVRRLGRFGAYEVHMPPAGILAGWDRILMDNGWTMVIGYS